MEIFSCILARVTVAFWRAGVMESGTGGVGAGEAGGEAGVSGGRET